ncbi:lysosomal alpha-mannosidase-like isoform X2 [Agrilus planipennis]|nr:lysosomal alpha-mannosidase-like isoform X2 [Agrilus planipennis]
MRAQFKQLIENGQLEIISGGWSMNDEAVTHYQSIIDQFTWGMRKLNETFGKCARPKVGWQIDPFGHSREMAFIFSQLGFDGVFLNRIDYQDQDKRRSSSSLEMIWKSSGSLENNSDIFTSVLYNHYSPPPGFCFDILCNDDPIIDNPESPDYNVERKVNSFLQYVETMKTNYRTNNLLITMGNDFNYQDADVWFKNLDKLIKYANQRQNDSSKYNLLYSTPSCYLNAVHDESSKKKLTWPVKTDDFFPYASDDHSYWTGYFTSRPTIKRFEREGNNFLQVCKQLYALAGLGSEEEDNLNSLREAMGVLQHHDAITGTEKQHVAADYARLLNRGFNQCSTATKTALNKLANNDTNNSSTAVEYQQCQFNISECTVSENENSFVVTIYNPLSRPVNNYVRLPVLHDNYEVHDPEGKKIATETISLPKAILNIPGRDSKATQEILFLAENLPPLGFKTYYVSKTEGVVSNKTHQEFQANPNKNSNGDVEVTKGDIGLTYNEETGLLTGIKMNGEYIPITQKFLLYRGFIGNNGNSANRSSGAYIFRPNDSNVYTVSEKATIETYLGSLIVEIRQTFSDWISQTIRLYCSENFVEFDWIVGPIPTDGGNGKEIITRYTTTLKTNSTFYTDSNGKEILKRVRNFRPTWDLNVFENASGNYYPVTSKISIRDETNGLEVAVLTDRPEGGSSLSDGEIELMIHRNCFADDSFGVGEALNEYAYGKGLVVRGSHYFSSGSFLKLTGDQTLASQQKDIAQRKLLRAWTFLAPTDGLSFKEYKEKHVLQYEGLVKALPKNVQILTLEPWIDQSFLLRLEHVFEVNEDPHWSSNQIVDLNDIFTSFEITSIEETTLGANQLLKENERLYFTRETNECRFDWKNANKIYDATKKLKIELMPMQIRTFIIDIKKK